MHIYLGMDTRKSREAIDAIRSLQEGDQEAFAVLMRILHNIVHYSVFRFARGNLGHRDDLLQEAWIAVYRAALSYDTAAYPDLRTSWFTTAITNHMVGTGLKTTIMLKPPRCVARFLHDVASGHVDWSQSDDEISRSYPRVKMDEIARARASADYRCTYTYSDFDDVHQVAFEDWLTTELDIEQMLHEVKAQLNPRQYHIFELRFLKELSRPEVAQLLKMSITEVHRIERQVLRFKLVVRRPSGSGKPQMLATVLREALALA